MFEILGHPNIFPIQALGLKSLCLVYFRLFTKNEKFRPKNSSCVQLGWTSSSTIQLQFICTTFNSKGHGGLSKAKGNHTHPHEPVFIKTPDNCSMLLTRWIAALLLPAVKLHGHSGKDHAAMKLELQKVTK